MQAIETTKAKAAKAAKQAELDAFIGPPDPHECVTLKAILAAMNEPGEAQFAPAAAEELRVDAERFDEIGGISRYEPIRTIGFDWIRVPLDEPGETAEAHRDENITWHVATYVLVMPDESRRYFRLTDDIDGWMVPWDATRVVREETQERLRNKRAGDDRNASLRTEQLTVARQLEALRTEPGRFRPPIEREHREDRYEKRLTGPVKISDAKMPMTVERGDEHNPIRDDDGAMVLVRTRSTDTLAMLQKASAATDSIITPQMVKAGRRFHAAFVTAQHDPLRGADYGRQGGGTPAEMSSRVLDAKNSVDAAMKHLGGHGSPMASAIWFIAGLGMNINAFAQREGFGTGRPLKWETAQRLLVGGLASLDEFYDTKADSVHLPPDDGSDQVTGHPVVKVAIIQARIAQGLLSRTVGDKLIDTVMGRRAKLKGGRP